MRERKIIELFDDGTQIYDWDWWKRNYIANQSRVFRGDATEYEREFWGKAVYYVREVGSPVLSPALKLRWKAILKTPSEPWNNDYAWFEDENGNNYAYNGEVLSFSYNPEFECEVPPVAVLDGPLTREILRAWSKWFFGPAYHVTRATQCDHGYRLSDSCPGCDADEERMRKSA
ncbi:hypothetical protein [Nonomuraea sp. SYSU D8015]|uniref:hypothetical protein n=1 Tax=Nonomuraea sp. SYSU D8015 TaxID=2593644 RepID=UPI00166012CD|nr:hypothetical protein [Nonomuraea sp. SYSU D8015]